MGLLFRRRVTLMPGVRLNLSGSGVSASFGPRGASFTVGGKRGPTMHFGIPGTGLYMRQSLGGGVSRSQAARWERQRLRELEREHALTEFEAHERELEALETILRRRESEPLDWETEFAPSPPPLPGTYEAPLPVPTAEDALRQVTSSHPASRWWLAATAAGIGAWLAPQPGIRIVLTIAAIALISDLVRVRQLLPGAAEELLRQREREYTRIEREARESFTREEEGRHNLYVAQESIKAEFRELEATRDFDLASRLLEIELSNEELGVPITFEIGFQSIHQVRLLIALPGLEAIPGERARLTKTGKLSRRAMAQRDRRALNETVCAGVVLRLVYETFRVLPFVTEVQAIGTATRPGLGQMVRRYPGVALDTTREALMATDLDGGEPESVLRYLGGRLSTARDGTLKPIEGVDDDLD